MLRLKQKPMRLFFLLGFFILLLSFLVAFPIYKSATMTQEEHMQQGLVDLKNKKFTSAQAHLRKAAQNQNANAFFILGQMEMEGKNGKNKADPKQAATYFENAARLGLKEAQYQLALLYDRAEGVEQNKNKALDWGLLSAAQENIDAMYASAVWLERGYSGKPEPYQALTLYEAAAQKGHKNAITTLISIYAGTEEIPANKERALYWKNKLAQQQTKNVNTQKVKEKVKK